MATPKERHDAQPGARSTGWSSRRHPPADALAAAPAPATPAPIPVVPLPHPPRPSPEGMDAASAASPGVGAA